MKRKRCFVLCFVLSLVLMFAGCATFNKSHTSHVAQQGQMVRQGRIDDVVQKLEVKARKGGRDGVLNALSAGYYYLSMQDYDNSRELFKIAEDQIEQYEERAKVNARDIAANAKAAVTSDMELPYKGEMFEKVMVNTMLTMNYLFKKDLQEANVEVRRAEIRQKEAIDKHQGELEKIEKQKKEKNIDDKSLNSIYANYNVLDEFSSKVINSFQNGFTYYLGGMVYELDNKPDDAYQDYYKSFSLFKNKYTLKKLIELSQELKMQTEYEQWVNMYKDLFNEEVQKQDPGPKPRNANAELVVVYFCGNVPQKTQAKFSLWLPQKSFNVAFPFYDKNNLYMNDGYLEINQNGETLGKTEMVFDFVPIVITALKEKLPGMVIRQIIRLIAKNKIENTAAKKIGFMGQIAAKVFNTVSERADLRGWYELPGNIQIFRAKIEAGPSTIALKETSSQGETWQNDIKLEVPEKGTALVLVHQLFSKKIAHSVVL
jgi:hypothetical protein